MADRIFSRGQTQVLYRYLPGAIFEHQDYGLCRVTSVAMEPVEVNRQALFDLLSNTLQQWERNEYRESYPEPRDEHRRWMYEVGEPTQVAFEPYPRTFICRRCKHVVPAKELEGKPGLTPGKCPLPGCDGLLVRLRYVQAHNCGRLEEFFLPSRGCPTHGTRYLAFDDPGRVAQAKWFCNKCRQEIQATRMTPCNCSYSNVVRGQGGSRSQQSLRIYPTGEPALYMSHVMPFINFSAQTETDLTSLTDAKGLLLARLWGILQVSVSGLASSRQRTPLRDNEANDEMMLKRVAEQLRQLDPENPLLAELERQQAHPERDAVRTVQGLIADPISIQQPPHRKLVEHVALLEGTRLTEVKDVVIQMKARGELALAEKFAGAVNLANEALGIEHVKVINDFPIALAALGYSRSTRDPAKCMIRPFPGRDKIPLYVIPTETEGLWFQLNPLKVANWLHLNGFLRGPLPYRMESAWAELYTHALNVDFGRREGEQSLVSHVVEMLIHTMSHVFLQRIEWSGFAASSIGEYLMPETLSFVLYANRYAEAKIGGLTTLFEQRLPMWLADAAQQGRHCVYDPLCSDDGGSCAGCLHREHNCSLFNRRLSRSLLYGGPLPMQEGQLQVPVSHGFWGDSDRVVDGMLG